MTYLETTMATAETMICPQHKTPMTHGYTQWGGRYQCGVDGCTYACWSGSTSTPANEETRKLRHECHNLFDPLWRGPQKKFKSRNAAYRWMQSQLNIPKALCHIGMFDQPRCEQLIKLLKS